MWRKIRSNSKDSIHFHAITSSPAGSPSSLWGLWARPCLACNVWQNFETWLCFERCRCSCCLWPPCSFVPKGCYLYFWIKGFAQYNGILPHCITFCSTHSSSTHFLNLCIWSFLIFYFFPFFLLENLLSLLFIYLFFACSSCFCASASHQCFGTVGIFPASVPCF